MLLILTTQTDTEMCYEYSQHRQKEKHAANMLHSHRPHRKCLHKLTMDLLWYLFTMIFTWHLYYGGYTNGDKYTKINKNKEKVYFSFC